MKDIEEYNRLVSDKANAQNRYDNVIIKRNSISDRIERLHNAKRLLDDMYDEYYYVKKEVSKDINHKYNWKGAKYNQFSGYGDALKNSNDAYYANLDNVRDDINLELSRLENQLYEQEGLLGQLKAFINSISHKIENFFND